MRKPIAISELLAQGKAKLERLKAGADEASRVLVAVQQAIPAEVAGHVFGATLGPDGVLTVLVDSGAWATRLRYALPEALPGLVAALGGDAITRTDVRVRPR